MFFEELRENSKPGKNDFAAKSSRPHHHDNDDARGNVRVFVTERVTRWLAGWLYFPSWQEYLGNEQWKEKT